MKGKFPDDPRTQINKQIFFSPHNLHREHLLVVTERTVDGVSSGKESVTSRLGKSTSIYWVWLHLLLYRGWPPPLRQLWPSSPSKDDHNPYGENDPNPSGWWDPHPGFEMTPTPLKKVTVLSISVKSLSHRGRRNLRRVYGGRVERSRVKKCHRSEMSYMEHSDSQSEHNIKSVNVLL